MEFRQLKKMIESDTSVVPPGTMLDGLVDANVLRQIMMKYGNIYQEMEMSNHVVNSHRDESPKSVKIEQHSHSFYELLYVFGGSCQYVLDNKRYVVQEGDVIVIAPGTSHMPIADESSDELVRKYVIWIKNDFVKMLSESFEDVKGSYPSAVIRTSGRKFHKQIEGIFKESASMTETDLKGIPAILAGNAIKFLVLLNNIDLENYGSMAVEKEELQDRILKYIEEHFTEKITSEDCAASLHVSDSLLRSNCSKKLGVSFHRYVTLRRLIEAKAIMEGSSENSLEDIALKVGFEDYSSFFRAFKKEYNLSPRDYRILNN